MPSGKNICNCPNPPGGQAICSEHQLAICRVENGVAYTECIDQPDEVASGSRHALNNWVLSQITGQYRNLTENIDPLGTKILREGVYHADDGQVVHFRVPVVKPKGAPAAMGG